ncbi:MAG: chitobiase/beta-hexosaminidase C-terminal domain-containing protein, partial [Candidatus Subteraquimicrobiales bacterium]|nr:chitobiase/beta-hexosaminidase C-terminal domain-containing protein [Candidatus Subteraquimicrobiales bacterium]
WAWKTEISMRMGLGIILGGQQIKSDGVAAPVIQPDAGYYPHAVSCTITCATLGYDAIYYTINGSMPTPASTLYTGAFSLYANTTVKAIATKNSKTSNVSTAIYEIELLQVAPIQLSPPGGTYTEEQAVTMSTATPDALIYYTTDGSEPTQASTLYTAPVAISADTTLKARGYRVDRNPSDITTAAYIITGTVAVPVITPETGSYTSIQTVSIACATSGATIRYTLDGSDPSTSSTLYTGTFSVEFTTTVKAKGYKTDWTPSAIATSTITVLFVMAVVPTGNGSATGTLALFFPDSENGKVITATGDVTLTDGLQSYTRVGNAFNSIVVTCASGSGTIVMPCTFTRFASTILSGNGWTSTTNAPSIYFAVARLPRAVLNFNLLGNNTVDGALEQLPTTLTRLNISGYTTRNFLSGNLSGIPMTCTIFVVTGNKNTVMDTGQAYAERSYANDINHFSLDQIDTSRGLTEAMVDQLLIDLDKSAWGGTSRTILLSDPNAARSAASDAAVTSLKAKSVTITIRGVVQ